MDASLLSVTYSTPWHIALIDELVDHLHQGYPDANWTNLPSLTSEVSVAKPQVLYARAACPTTSAQSNGNNNGNGNSTSNGNGSTNTDGSGNSGGNTTLIAAVAGAVGGCLLLAGIIFFFYRRHVKRKHAAQSPAAPLAPPANSTMLQNTPMAGGKAQPMQFQGGPMPMATPPSTYVPSSSGDSSSQYNYPAPLSPQWTGGMPSAVPTHLGYPHPSSRHPSSYYTTSSPGPHPMTSTSSVAAPPPWAVPMDPNLQPHPQAYLTPSPPIVSPGHSPSPGMEKTQFSGYAIPVHQNTLPAWAVDHKRPGSSSRPSIPNSASASGSGAGGSISNVLEQPGDALPPPAYSATPSSM